MKILTLNVMIVLAFNTKASNLFINQSQLQISETPTRIDCGFISVVGQESNQCCIGNTCQNLTSIQLNHPVNNTSCPKIAIDNHIYDVNGPIDIHHDLRIYIAQPVGVTNCRNGNGQDPTLGTGFLTVLNIETIGVENSYFDVDNWILNINSIDGDVVCDGGMIYDNPDIIYLNSFE